MTFLLLQAIQQFLKAEFEQTVCKEPDGWFTTPRIFLGALPPKRKLKGEDQKEDFPFIVVRARDGKDDDNAATADIELVCGIYSDQEADDADTTGAGDNDIMNLVDRIRRALLQQRVLAGRFELRLPLTWKLADDDMRQPHPYYLAMVTSSWEAPAIDRQLTPEQEAQIYGTGFQE